MVFPFAKAMAWAVLERISNSRRFSEISEIGSYLELAQKMNENIGEKTN